MSVGESLETVSRPAARGEPHPAAGAPPTLARALAVASSALLGAVLPVLMVVANKSAPAVLGAAALAATAAALLAGRGAELLARCRAVPRSPIAIVVALGVLLCLASFGWTIDARLTRRGLLEGLPELVFAALLATAWPLVARPPDRR